MMPAPSRPARRLAGRMLAASAWRMRRRFRASRCRASPLRSSQAHWVRRAHGLVAAQNSRHHRVAELSPPASDGVRVPSARRKSWAPSRARASRSRRPTLARPAWRSASDRARRMQRGGVCGGARAEASEWPRHVAALGRAPELSVKSVSSEHSRGKRRVRR